MVLAIGILVDDAIVVVENVERIMSEEGLPPKEATRKAMDADHRRDHRHHAGADRGVRADGVLPRLGRHHLSAVLGDHGVGDRLLGAAGAVADAGAVRDAAEAGGTDHHAEARLLRLVQSQAGRRQATRYSGMVRLEPEAHRPADGALRVLLVGARLGFRAAARRLPADRRSGLHHRRRADAVGCLLQPHLRRGEEGRGLSDRSATASTTSPSSPASASSARA